MCTRWGNVSHTARGGVDNHVDDSARRARSVVGNVSHSACGGVDNHHHEPADRTRAHDRRRPRHPPVLRNGGWRGLRLTINNSTSPPLRAVNTPSQFQPALAFDRASASRRGIRLANSNVRGAASAPG